MPTNQRIKVVHIASGDLWAGAEVQLYTLVRTLKNEINLDVHVVLLNHGMLEEKLVSENIPVTVIDEKKLNSLKITILLCKELRRIKPNIVHTHRQKENILGSIACILSGNIPSIRTVHGAPEHRPNWQHILKRAIYSLDQICGILIQKAVVAVSGDLAQMLSRKFSARKIFVIENGVDIATASTPPIAPTIIETPSACSFLKIAVAGRLVPVKRVDMALKSTKYLLNHFPELRVKLHIFGDGPLRGELELLTKQLGIADVVKFEGHCDNIRERLPQFDTLLITSDHEGLPMILLEAIASGIIPVAHAVGGIPTVINTVEMGFLVGRQDEQSYASQLVRVASIDEAKYKQIATSGWRLLKTHYSSVANASQYKEIYVREMR